MSKILIIVIFISPLFCYAQEGEEVVADTNPDTKKETLNLVVGIKKVVKIDFDADFANLLTINNVSDKMTMKPVEGLNEIIFEGKKPSNTNIIIKDKTGKTRLEYNVVITETDQSRTVHAIRELIGDIEGIEIGIRANKIVIDGQIIVPKDIARLSAAIDLYKEREDIFFFAEPSPHSMVIIAKRMQNEIQNSGMRDVTVRVVNDSFWLEGVVKSSSQRKDAGSIANALLPAKIATPAEDARFVSRGLQAPVRNFIQVNSQKPDKPFPKLIKIVAQFVELSRDYARTFGFRWAPTFTGGGGIVAVGKTDAGTLSTSSQGSLSAVISNLFPKLAAARSAGDARVIQSGMVITEDKTDATINKSTNIPFSSGTGEFTRAQNAQATFSIKTTPEILKKEKIKMRGLTVNVSIVTGQTTDGAPLVTNNSVSTNLIVDSGDSAVVGGVFQSQTNTAYDKLPSSGEEEGDLLFNFVRSRDYRNSKNQFVVFLTPEIVDSASRDADKIKRKFYRRIR